MLQNLIYFIGRVDEMSLPELLMLEQYPADIYIDAVYEVYKKEVVNGDLTFLNLPIKCPWHPPFQNKHFSFWHLISEKGGSNLEADRVPDIRRCERIKWISYVIINAYDCSKILCWEKEVQTSRGRNKHIHLYLHEERYLVVLRKEKKRLDIVTTFVVREHNHQKKIKEAKQYTDTDPRNS